MTSLTFPRRRRVAGPVDGRRRERAVGGARRNEALRRRARVDGASFDVVAGSLTALIGPNGAGKSSLFNIVSGFLRPERGTVRFGAHAIERRAPHRIARAGLVRTFQTPRALTRLSVLENVLLAAPRPWANGWGASPSPRTARADERAAEREARRLLALVRLDSATPTRTPARSRAASGSCSISCAY